MKTERFVFDTNTLVSAFLFFRSKPTLAYEKEKSLGSLVASEETFPEFSNIMLRPKFERYVTLGTRINFIKYGKSVFSFHNVTEKITACRDPKDDKFLELAVAANADCIISGDEDLLILHPFRNIPILNAADFLVQF